MSDQADWVEALKIKPEQLDQWSSEAAEGVPLLVWCLQEKRVPWDNYAQWASKNYQLPHLDSHYFDGDFDASAVAGYHSNELWSEWCFPLEKWDDVTIVACAVPPSMPAPDGENFAYVLADPAKLKEIWNSSAQSEMAPPALPTEAPSVLSLETKPFVLNLNLGPAASEPAAHESASHEPPPLPPETPAAPAAAPAAAPIETPTLALKLATPSGGTDEIETAFKQLKTRYANAVVMMAAKLKLKLKRWDGDLHPVNAEFVVDLDAPSFFRIAARTNLPYHGYVVETPIHQEFFRALGVNFLPPCVTAVPIKVSDEFRGLLVAWGDEPAQSSDCLQMAESVGAKLSS